MKLVPGAICEFIMNWQGEGAAIYRGDAIYNERQRRFHIWQLLDSTFAVCLAVCACVCLSVSLITQKIINLGT